jgi:hypothetical protein
MIRKRLVLAAHRFGTAARGSRDGRRLAQAQTASESWERLVIETEVDLALGDARMPADATWRGQEAGELASVRPFAEHPSQ